MEFNLFIIPITLIIVQLLKPLKFLDQTYLPHLAVFLGLAMGVLFGVYYGVDLFVHAVYGAIFGASAAGIYDAAKSTKETLTGGK